MKDYPVIYKGYLYRMKTDMEYELFVRWRSEFPNLQVVIYDDTETITVFIGDVYPCYTNSIYRRKQL